MKNFKIKSIFFSLIALCAISAFLVSCEREVIDQVEYSGEDYFKAIFLMEGELAKKITSYEYFIQHKENVLAENPSSERHNELANKYVMAHVNEIDPSFFEDLKYAVDSRDANLVESALVRGSTHLDNTKDPALADIMSKIDINDYDLDSEEGVSAYMADVDNLLANEGILHTEIGDDYVDGRVCSVVAVCVAGVALAVGGVVALAVGGVAAGAAALVVWKWKYVWTPKTGGEMNASDKYAHEKLINEIISLSPVYN